MTAPQPPFADEPAPGPPFAEPVATPDRDGGGGGGPAPLRAPGRLFAAIPGMIGPLIVLGLVGLSVGEAAWIVFAKVPTIAFVTTNNLSARARIGELVWMAAGAALFAGVAPLAFALRRGAARLSQLSDRLCPLVLVAPLPLLFRWKIWNGGRELTFLAFVSLVGLGTGPLVARALAAPPLWPGLARRLAALRASVHAPAWLPFALVVVGSAFYAVFFSFFTIRYHRNGHSSSFDLAIENNLMWNLVHGGQFFKTSPLVGPVGSHFGYHAYFFAYVLAPIYALAQRPETLLIIQAVLMGGAAVPLYLLAERRVGPWYACVLGLCFVMYAPMHGANLYDFHYTPLSTFFIWSTFYLLDARRDGLAIVAAILTLSVREDIPPGLVVVGLYFVLSRERPIAGTILAGVSVVYFLVLKMAVMPRWLADSSSYTYIYWGLMPEGDHGYGGVLKTVLGNPGFTFDSLLERDKLVYALEIMTPLAFVPMRRGATAVLFLPGFLFTLLSTGYAPVIQTSFQYTAHWTTYVFLAAALHLGTMRRAGPDGHRRAAGWLVAIVVCTLTTSYQFGAFLQQQNVRGGFGVYKFKTDADDLARRAELAELIAMVPPRAKIAASEFVAPHVSSRPDCYTLRIGLFDAEYILFSLTEQNGAEYGPVGNVLHDNSFGVVAIKGHYALLRRGAPITQNAALLARIGR